MRQRVIPRISIHIVMVFLGLLSFAAAPAPGVELDASSLRLPEGSAAAAALGDARSFRFDLGMSPSAVEAMVGPGEYLALVDRRGGREIRESASWSYEFDPQEGSMLLSRRTVSSPKVAPFLDAPSLEAAARKDVARRTTALGIRDSEIGSTSVRRLRRAAKSVGDTVVTDGVVAVKAFVERRLAGVPVINSRLVLTYALDGSLGRILGHWPELAPEGHRLTTTLTAAQVLEEARGHMKPRLQGRAVEGPIRVDLVYEEEPVGDGSVRLVLRARATVIPDGSEGMTQPWQELVPLSR